MASQRFPLRINVGYFHNLPVGSYRDIHFEFPEVHLPPDQDLKQLTGLVHISRTPQGLLFEGNFEAVMPSECVRCLEPFELQLNIDFEEVFAYKSTTFTESGLYVPEDGNIDLSPVIREYMMLDTPINPLCIPDCQGLCIVCGENLNKTECEHHARIKLD
ncbi:MAG: DUF177 domain-containing protein [Chloroflexi bacterium]|nr:DUF177 domain-containing protein [Chloroflexota bacterium]